MKIFYAGNICSDEFFLNLTKTQKFPPSYAQLKLEKNLMDGFDELDGDVTAVGQYPIRSFPGNKKIIIPKNKIEKNRIKMINPMMINILGIKQIVQFFSIFFYFISWILKNRKQEKTFFSYSTYPPVTLPCLLIAKLCKVRTITYVSEVPKLRLYYNQSNILRKALVKLNTALSMYASKKFDYYVYTTEATGDFFTKHQDRYTVIEGITKLRKDEVFPQKDTIKTSKDQFIVMYAGGINQQNGIELLLDTWLLLSEHYVLWLFGDGDYTPVLKEKIKDHKNIIFYGNKSNAEILEWERKADLLINPRFATGKFTKYSFPSKTIEYLESGTPTLTSALEGIPKEYYNYLTILKPTASELAEQLKELSNEGYSSAKDKSEKGFYFIRDKKNAKQQVSKIYHLLKNYEG